MIRRDIQKRAIALAGAFPVLTITGPRQSGKTTLCRMAFPDKPYANLEVPDVRDFARSDPRGFLAGFPDGAVLDEIQRAPDLLSYIQDRVDRRRRRGEFVLTGSQNLDLLGNVTQSLAGRTAILNLLPLSLAEVRRFANPPRDLFEVLFHGGYPAIHAEGVAPSDWLGAYVTTYVERDVRQVLRVGDLLSFQTFLALCAGRNAGLLNLSSLGADSGITHNTARAWVSVLETGFILTRLPAFARNPRKRLAKSPKLVFYDSGLACFLLGIRSAGQLRAHPLRGAIFEAWVATEILKARLNRGLPAGLSHYRDHAGQEIDLVLETGDRLLAIEVKSGATPPSDAFAPLTRFAEAHRELPAVPARVEKVVVYGGSEGQRRSDGLLVPWDRIRSLDLGSTGGPATA